MDEETHIDVNMNKFKEKRDEIIQKFAEKGKEVKKLRIRNNFGYSSFEASEPRHTVRFDGQVDRSQRNKAFDLNP